MFGPATYFLFLKYIYWLQGIGYWLRSNNLKVFVLVLSIYYFSTTSYLDSVFDIYIIWIARQNTMRLFLWSPAYTTENYCSLSSNWKPLLRFLIFFFSIAVFPSFLCGNDRVNLLYNHLYLHASKNENCVVLKIKYNIINVLNTPKWIRRES